MDCGIYPEAVRTITTAKNNNCILYNMTKADNAAKADKAASAFRAVKADRADKIASGEYVEGVHYTNSRGPWITNNGRALPGTYKEDGSARTPEGSFIKGKFTGDFAGLGKGLATWGGVKSKRRRRKKNTTSRKRRKPTRKPPRKSNRKTRRKRTRKRK
jgi:hypothetical protein